MFEAFVAKWEKILNIKTRNYQSLSHSGEPHLQVFTTYRIIKSFCY